MVNSEQVAGQVQAAVKACALGIVSGMYDGPADAIKRYDSGGLLDYTSHESSVRKKVKELKPQAAALRQNRDVVENVLGGGAELGAEDGVAEVQKAATNEQPWIAWSGLAPDAWAALPEPDRDKVRYTHRRKPCPPARDLTHRPALLADLLQVGFARRV